MCDIQRGDVVTSSWLVGKWIVGFRGKGVDEDWRWLYPSGKYGPSILIHESRIIPPGKKRDAWERGDRT